MLMVYVDDFKLAGPSGNLAKGWQLIKSKVTLGKDGPSKMGLCLGCHHERFYRTYNGKKVTGVRYNMQHSLEQAVEHYENLCAKNGHKCVLKPKT